jgi:hypothetical protein
VDKYEQREALQQLQRYLSDTIAPMIFADSMDILFVTPPEHITAQVASWVASLHGVESKLATADYLFHAAKKIHLLGELELLPRDQIAAFLRGLRPNLLAACPEQDRGSLANDYNNLELSQGAEAPSVIGHIHRAGGAEVSRGQAVRADRPVETGVAGGSAAAGESVARGFLKGLRRVNMLLERMTGHADAGSGTAAVAAIAGSPEEKTLVARIVTEAADRATSSDELHGSLDELRSQGLPIDAAQLLRLLAHNLPNWARRRASIRECRCRRRPAPWVRLSPCPGPGRRSASGAGELRGRGVQHGSLGRAVTRSTSPAGRKQRGGRCDRHLRQPGHGRSIGVGCGNTWRTRISITCCGAWWLLPRFAPAELFGELEAESNRDRRRFLLMVLNAQAEATRKAALEKLHEVAAGDASYPWYFERNLVYLLRTTRRPSDAPADPEIDVLIPMSELEGPLPLVREALATLGQIQHERAVTALVARVSELEDALLGRRQLPHDEDELGRCSTAWPACLRAARRRRPGAASSSTASSGSRSWGTRWRECPSCPARTCPRTGPRSTGSSAASATSFRARCSG